MALIKDGVLTISNRAQLQTVEGGAAELINRIDNLSNQLANKADKTTVEALSGVVANKADKSSVTANLTIVTDVDFVEGTTTTAVLKIVNGIITEIL